MIQNSIKAEYSVTAVLQCYYRARIQSEKLVGVGENPTRLSGFLVLTVLLH